MKKMHYLLISAIIVLVVWSVVDFIENKAEAESMTKTFGIGSSDNNKIIVKFPPKPNQPRSNWPYFFIPQIKETPVIKTPTAVYFMLTGTIIEPASAVAAIRNTKNNHEGAYRIGDNLDSEWNVIAIFANQAKIKNRQDEIITLKISGTSYEYDQGKKSGQSEEVQPQFGKPKIPPGIQHPIKKQIYETLRDLPREQAIQIIQKYTNLAEEDLPLEGEDLAEWAAKMYGIYDLDEVFNVAPLVIDILFSTSVNPDNSPASPQNVFKQSDRRIYACFASQEEVEGLTKIFVRWTNRTTGKMEHFNSFPITPDASFNFVWLERKEGWQSGEYEVEIFKTQTSDKIAGGKFEISR